MVTSAFGRPTSRCRVASLLLAGLFLASIATQAPHLVHHFFERDHVKDQCPFAASGERSGGLPLEPVAVVATPDVSTPTLPAVFMAPPSGGPTASRGRAPPLRLS
ncbi:MAG: hypothetical protein DMD96_18100 [Candidatus Rokuibacteriota bacterium]|nr:MAG: hypothetical protein DMD96_18100 [Candidatus Rokubacteria bacterium]